MQAIAIASELAHDGNPFRALPPGTLPGTFPAERKPPSAATLRTMRSDAPADCGRADALVPRGSPPDIRSIPRAGAQEGKSKHR